LSVNQVDLNYYIPGSNSKGSFHIPDFNGAFKVKHLDTIYQVYHKNLLTKGHCIRAEENINFSNEQHPTLASLPDTVVPTPPQEILNVVILSSQDLSPPRTTNTIS